MKNDEEWVLNNNIFIKHIGHHTCFMLLLVLINNKTISIMQIFTLLYYIDNMFMKKIN